MLIASDNAGLLVIAENFQGQSSQFFCPECRHPVVLKRGAWKISHFAHKPGRPPDCEHENESEQHALTKYDIYRTALETPGVRFAAMEYRTGRRIADVVLHGAKRRVAIEIQLSPISLDLICQRTTDHARAGYTVLWVLDLGQAPDTVERKETYPVKAFQRALHAAYGCIFQHAGGLTFDTCRLAGYRLETRKYLYFSYAKVHLFDTVDENGLVKLNHRSRWWERAE